MKQVPEYINGFALGYSVSASGVPDSEYHCRNDYEIMYIRKGGRLAFVKERSYDLRAGNLLFINKTELHKTRYLTDEYERFVINFTDDYVLPAVAKDMHILFEQHIYAPPRLGHIDKLFTAIYDEWEKMRGGDELARDNIAAYVNLLLTLFIRRHSEYAYNDAKLVNPAIERLLRYMNENYRTQITLADAASMLHLSRSHLSRTFLRYTGFGFLDYLKILRIEGSKTMLENTKLSVKDIAFEVGFNDSNYFSSVFKHETGMSPLEYRRVNAI